MNPIYPNKILSHLNAVLDYANGRVPVPIVIELDMTNACNHRCPCCAGGNSSEESLSLNEAIGFLNQVHDYGVKAIVFTGGGEPLMSRHTMDAVEHASALGLEIGFITNGSRLDRETTIRLLKKCTWMRVSLDANSAAMFHTTHGRDEKEYNNVVENIIAAANMKRKSGSLCILSVGYLTGKQTREGMVDAARSFSDSGVNFIQFRPFVGDCTSVIDEYQKCRQYETDNYRVVFSQARYATQIGRSYSYCHAAHFMGIIQADGNMPICCHLRGRPEFYIGNLKEKSLRSVWGGKRKAEILKSLDTCRCPENCHCDCHNSILHEIVTRKPCANFL